MRRVSLLLIAFALVSVALFATSTWAQSPNRVGLVVRYGDGEVVTRCIEFDEAAISGLDVLLRSGLKVVYSAGGVGATVCKIGRDGCDDPAHCFCRCRGNKCEYWSYWHLVDGEWQYSGVGASDYKVRPGAVEGWVWGVGTISNAPRPPLIGFDDICRRPTYTPTDTPPPPSPTTTSTPCPPTPTPTAVRIPSATPRPRASPTMTCTPRPSPAPTTIGTAAVVKGRPVAGILSFFLLLVILGTIGVVVGRRQRR